MHFNYNYGEEGDRLLPLLRISDSDRRYLAEEQNGESLERIEKEIELYNRAASKIGKQYPDLLSPIIMFRHIDYPGFFKAPRKNLGLRRVKLNQIVGDSWVNISLEVRRTVEKFGHLVNYPKQEKLLKVMLEMLGLRAGKNRPIDLIKINDHYFVDDGSHRIYAARLLELEEIEANVVEYDYEGLKPNLKLLNHKGKTLLGVKKENNVDAYEKITICPEAVEVLKTVHRIEEINL
jgi:hypothetical protein